jgi:hypothetical protein
VDGNNGGGLAFLVGEFLTWLWFEAERNGGVVQIDGAGAVSVGFVRKLVLESPGAIIEGHAVTADLPTLADEARTALKTGKKVALASLVLDVEDRHFEATVHAETMTLRSVKLPVVLDAEDSEQLDERLVLLDELEMIVDGLYLTYARLRLNSARWPETRAAMSAWIQSSSEVE